ncbi:hypothetical protein, partial [Pseudomonas edaphica]|uniref:hypothetical protein n=1 Tax=Pseudomonas edaphica TaxID=2006980 RepID=UPI0019824853
SGREAGARRSWKTATVEALETTTILVVVFNGKIFFMSHPSEFLKKIFEQWLLNRIFSPQN